jgi:hypothetical protein
MKKPMSKDIKKMIDKIKNFKQFVNKNVSVVDNIQKLYKKYGNKYPYATDAIAYYIFGDKSDDNILLRFYKGVYGRNSQVDSSEVSSYMLDNEYSWEENIKDIDNFIKNLFISDERRGLNSTNFK